MTYRVYVDGQLGIPFDKKEDAIEYAKNMQLEGFDTQIIKENT